MAPEFDEIFKISTLALTISRSHPYIKRDKKWLLQFIILHGLFTLAFCLVAYNIVCFNLKENNFSQTCKNGILCVVYTVITFQYGVLLWHQESLLDLINDVKRDYELSKKFKAQDRKVIYNYAKKGRWVCLQWLVITVTTCGLFIVKSIVLMIYYYIIDDFKLVPIYDLIYPSVIENNKDNIFVFLMTNSLMLTFDCYSGIVYTASVPIGPIIILHACGQLELVERQIDNLFVDCDDQVVKEKLKRIIMQLQYIYGFVERIKDIFKVAYELTLKATSIMLPITFYEVIEAFNNGEVSLEFITFLVGASTFSGAPCYYSDFLMEKGEDVRQSLYKCGWEFKYDRRTRITLQLMLERALRPIAIQTVFRTLCLDSLTDVFQQSYAIFSLINAMWN